MNLAQGQAKTIRVAFDREEDYRGAVMVAAESLPPGVSAVAGADFEPDKDPPSTIGKRERYTAAHRASGRGAHCRAPMRRSPRSRRKCGWWSRPLVDGKPGEVLSTKTFPMMVLAKP